MNKRFVKAVGGALTAAMVFGAVVPAYANEVPTQAVEISVSVADLEQLNYAIEEMRIVVDYLDNKNLAVEENTEYMLSFATAAIERVRGLSEETLTEQAGHVEWIFTTGEEVRVKVDTARILMQAMENVETVFHPDRNDTIENKTEVLKQLNAALSHALYSGYANYETCINVNRFLHEYVGILEDQINNSQSTDETEQNYAEYQELAYAIEEMRIVVDFIDNQNLALTENVEYMLTFATSAIERVRGLSEATLTAEAGHVEWIFETGEEVRVNVDAARKLIEVMERVEIVCGDASNATLEEKKIVLDELNAELSDAIYVVHINETTAVYVNNFLHEYVNKYVEDCAK